MQKLDGREMIPRERHPRIVAMFDDLETDEAFELINDHDPKPLFYQFQAEQSDRVRDGRVTPRTRS